MSDYRSERSRQGLKNSRSHHVCFSTKKVTPLQPIIPGRSGMGSCLKACEVKAKSHWKLQLYKPDTLTLLKSGHFNFALTSRIFFLTTQALSDIYFASRCLLSSCSSKFYKKMTEYIFIRYPD